MAQVLPFLIKSFYLWLRLFYFRVVFAAYGKLAMSSLLTVEVRFGLLCLRWKIGLVSYLQFPPVQKLDQVFFAYGSPAASKKDEP